MNSILKTFLPSLVYSFLLLIAPARAQITPDTTLGNSSSRLVPNQIMGGASANRIDGGAQRGINLFHSFSQFNIGDGQRVYFSNPVGVQNILTRVTGASASNILGTLGVDGAANLFLINPNGILFGQNARLDVQSSFVGTTANGVRFGDFGVFDVGDKQAPGLLTVNPSAFLFNQINTGKINNSSSAFTGFSRYGEPAFGLRVPDGQNLILLGSDVNIQNGGLTAFGGNIEIGAVYNNTSVGLNQNGSLTFPNDFKAGNITITDSLINVADTENGSITLNANDINISGSLIKAGIQRGNINPNAKAGDITLNAGNKVQIGEQSRIVNWVFPGAIGQGGNININTNSLSFTEGDYISASTWGLGSSGNVSINAANNIFLGGSTIFSLVETDAVGNSGNIDITTTNLRLENGARISSSTFGQGNAGNVTINATESVNTDGTNSQLYPSAIVSSVDDEAVGNGGNILINTGSLLVTNSAKLDTSVFGKGNGGDIIINARDKVLVDGVVRGADNASTIFSTLEEVASGKAGNIRISTKNLFLTNGGGLQSITRNDGNAGNIFVEASDSILIEGTGIQNLIDKGSEGLFIYAIASGIESSVVDGAVGNAGEIQINAANGITLNDRGFIRGSVGLGAKGNGGDISITSQSLFLNKDSTISANTQGNGNGGNIIIETSYFLTLDNDSVIGSIVFSKGIGDSGDIRINTGSLALYNASQLDSTTYGLGSAGDVIINARNTITFDGKKDNRSSGILSTSEGSEGLLRGNSGNINIFGNIVNLSNSARLSTITTRKGDAGNITINALNTISLTSGSELISATVGQGNAGSINISAPELINISDYSSIFTTVGENGIGVGGNIDIAARFLTITNNSFLSSSTYAQGNAGNITLNVGESILFDNESVLASIVGNDAKGNGGNIRINSGSFTAKNASVLQTSTDGLGSAGNVVLNVRDKIIFDGFKIDKEGQIYFSGINSSVLENGVGNAGSINIDANSLLLNNAQLQARTEGQGSVGDIFINARDSIVINRSIISNIVGNVLSPGRLGNGKGGTIKINTDSLSMTNGGQLQASTFGTGNAGDIVIDARNVSFAGVAFVEGRLLPSAAFSVVADDSQGNGGNIIVKTDNLSITDGARLGVSSFGQGNAGNINIDARSNVIIEGKDDLNGLQSRLSSTTEDVSTGVGGKISVNADYFRISNEAIIDAQTTSSQRGGDITVNAKTFESTTGGRVVTTASNSGQAGSITVNANRINLSKSGLFANTTTGASATGGDIKINAPELNLFDNAQVSVNSLGSGVAGNIDVNASRIRLANAKIIAETASTDGGSININNADLLVLRNNSLISTTAGLDSGAGNGGNININAGAIVAVPRENSDIRANAFEGRGGNVNINTNGLFGIAASRFDTFESNITASSALGVQGQILIQQPEVQPAQGLIELPEEVVDATRRVAQICPREPLAKPLGEFTITGRGSLPPSPLEPLTGNTTTRALANDEQGNLEKAPFHVKNNSPAPQIVEAQGWVKTADGGVELIAVAPSVTPNSTKATENCVGYSPSQSYKRRL